MDEKASVKRAVERCLAAIEQLDGHVLAWETVFAEEALRQAEALDREERPCPLKGLVVGLKDVFDLAGRPPGNGAPVKSDRVPKEDAALVRQLRSAGAVILGTTKLTEFCWYRPTVTRNPHHLDHTPGGSSSGSAAAVAAGMVPFAVGTQTNGSVIRPASFCGIYGFKPTFGIVDTLGMSHISRSLDHPGFFSREPEWLLRVFDVLTGYGGTGTAVATERIQPSVVSRRLKVGVLDTSPMEGITPDALAAVKRYAEALAAQGIAVREMRVPAWFLNVKETFESIFHPEVYSLLGPVLAAAEGIPIGPEIRWVVEQGSKASIQSYLDGLRRKDELTWKVTELFGDCDLLVLPSTLGPAPKGLSSTGNPAMSTLSSIVGLPCASIPFGTSADGLPLGVQVWARKYHDRDLLSVLPQLPAQLVRPPYFAE
ncbi:MAG: amidase [Alicyclobacillus macrosporangiidus]|uniref:amidase n=1 Tax=Alicyclobacillus macrosporangiidus TaxID=392015 RepID=UPI0026ECE84E|nr:amidase [Alicyclobacillus macrosporangiidus]MCL6597191.1 amidase [Alicyclobacillus macrosporangiidus]